MAKLYKFLGTNSSSDLLAIKTSLSKGKKIIPFVNLQGRFDTLIDGVKRAVNCGDDKAPLKLSPLNILMRYGEQGMVELIFLIWRNGPYIKRVRSFLAIFYHPPSPCTPNDAIVAK